jgi:hypothetical protein
MQIKINRLSILSCHSILDQVAEDIAKGIAVDALPDKDIVVCIGAHKRFKGLRKNAGFKICVQTEHFWMHEAKLSGESHDGSGCLPTFCFVI